MEKADAPKCRSFHRGCERTSADRVRVDSKCDSDEVRRESPRRRSDQPREFFLHSFTLGRQLDIPKLLDVAEGLNYLHTNHTIHGDLKGVRTFSAPLQTALTALG